ncbi:MAG: hypothetical protein HZA50_09010 [Planctomycetes bacterium]|nr:hypothetical protein [Planctomycetota bacterium]
MQSSAHVRHAGQKISAVAYCNLKGWQAAGVPGTVLANLIKNGVYKDPYFGKNLLEIPREPFLCSWWYRTEFRLPKGPKRFVRLFLDGVNYRAAIWLNGRRVAGEDAVFGVFRRFEFDVTEFVNWQGRNALAIEVFPPKPEDYAMGFVDWNPAPPDRNMGLWRQAGLRLTGPVRIGNPCVTTELDLPGMKTADLRIAADLTNCGEAPVSGELVATVEDIVVRQTLTLAAGESWTAAFDVKHFPELRLKNPRVWWPHTLGEPNLYQLDLKFLVKGKSSDRSSVTFGVREIKEYFNEQGLKGLKVNGEPLMLRGAGWTDDMMLADTPEKIEHQIQYARHIRLNCIRFEGFWGSTPLVYDLCDRYGLLFVAGWSCEWEWEWYIRGPVRQNNTHIMTAEGEDLICKYLESQVRQLRNHAGLSGWLIGSDLLWEPQMERRQREILDRLDKGRVIFTHIERTESPVSGPSGISSAGPYQFVPPVFWYSGKAEGINFEACPGAEPPPLESMRRMIPAEHLWPMDAHWDFHCSRNTEEYHNYQNLDFFCKALKLRYSYWNSPEDFLRRAQIMNYELMRSMFEAYAVNRPRATGIIQWMFNGAWPKLYWQLFDHYLMPNGAFYAVRKANEPLHLAYNYKENAVYAVNEHRRAVAGLAAEIRLLTTELKVCHEAAVPFSVPANASARIHSLPAAEGLTETYFLDLRLRKDGKSVSDNLYWLSTKPDTLSTPEEVGAMVWRCNKSKDFANLVGLRRIPPTTLTVKAASCRDGDMIETTVDLKNTGGQIAFFLELMLVGDRSGMSFLPVFWDDNYVSLFPGESRTLKARFPAGLLKGQRPLLRADGINIAPTSIAAPI